MHARRSPNGHHGVRAEGLTSSYGRGGCEFFGQLVGRTTAMTEDNTRTDTTVSPKEEPAPTPLISAADVPLPQFPIVHIRQGRRAALVERARQMAESWYSEPRDHIKGLLGEAALAKFLGIESELNVEVYTDGGDGGVDLRYHGASIDVKTVGQHYSDPPLTVDVYESLTADYYVLASQIGCSDIRLIGYAPRRFVANAPQCDSEGGKYHIVWQDYLYPFSRR